MPATIAARPGALTLRATPAGRRPDGEDDVTSVTRLTAVYPGTFDPMTLGHEDLMRRASRLFERLLVAVAAGHHKRTMFSIAERLEIAQELSAKYPNVEVMAFRACCATSSSSRAARSSSAACARSATSSTSSRWPA